MNAEERRKKILAVLKKADKPLTATQLAGQFSVSRQIVVGDVALLRAVGEKITATPRGYVLQREEKGLLFSVPCVHTAENMGPELYAMVDNGCAVLDVIVEHPVYGELTGQLQCSSRHDVEAFLKAAQGAQPLSTLTGGIHLHTIRCPDEATYQRTLEALDRLGVLVK